MLLCSLHDVFFMSIEDVLYLWLVYYITSHVYVLRIFKGVSLTVALISRDIMNIKTTTIGNDKFKIKHIQGIIPQLHLPVFPRLNNLIKLSNEPITKHNAIYSIYISQTSKKKITMKLRKKIKFNIRLKNDYSRRVRWNLHEQTSFANRG